MTTMTASSNNLHSVENGSKPNSKSSSPTSPTFFQHQQTSPSRSFINLNANIRGQTAPFPSTPTPSHMNGLLLEPPSGMAYRDFIRTWTDNHVVRWLTNIKCGNHAELFKANDIRGDVLLELDQDTLKEVGVASIGDRLRILNAVKSLRLKSSARVPSNNVTPPRLIVNDDASGAGHDSAAVNRGTTSESSPNTRLPSRRPAPLQLDQNPRENGLPRVAQDGLSAPESARIHHSIRPLPHPVQANAAALPVPATPNPSLSSSNIRQNLPPAPRIQPPLPPPTRSTVRNATQFGGRRTPTQPDVPSYVSSPLPPAPSNSLLTPNAATSNRNGYGLPANQRQGNARTTPARLNLAAHARNISMSGIESPVSTSPASRLPPRPSTGNNSGHPYASAQPSSTLQPPNAPQPGYALSPIAEAFNTPNGATSSPLSAYTVGRGPFNRPNTPSHGPTPSLDDLRRKLVKFQLADEGHSYTINVSDCAGGIEVLEKVLRKFGKTGGRSTDTDNAMEHAQTEGGGLSVDGWGVYIDWYQSDEPGEQGSFIFL
jgi:mitogen-activated protein kinase kinase kinase